MGKATEYHFTPGLKWRVMFEGMGLDSEQYKQDGNIDLRFHQENIVEYIDTTGATIYRHYDYDLSVVETPAIFSSYERICFAPNNYVQQQDSRVFAKEGNYWKFETPPDFVYDMTFFGYNPSNVNNPISIMTTLPTIHLIVNNVLIDGTKIKKQDYTGRGGHRFTFSCGSGWYDASRGAPEGFIEFYSNIPVFGNYNDAMAYLTTGQLKPTVDAFLYKLSSKTFSSDVAGDYVNELAKTLSVFEIEKPSGDDAGKIAGYVVESENQYNIAIKYDDVFASQLKSRKQYINGVEFEPYTNPFHTYTTLQHTADGFYIGQILAETNIPIYRSIGDANSYLDGTGNPTPVYDNGGSGSGENTTGENDDETLMNTTAENGTILSSVYLMTKEQLQAFGGVIYSDNNETITAIKEGLALYGENPINFVVDCFYVPFDISTFVTTRDTTQIKFGSYTAELSAKKVTGNNFLVSIASVDIVGAYNDYRDYDYNYYLYLPYVGISALDIETIIYKTLNIKTFFDVRTGNIKYYIFANLNLIKTYEGNIRVSMPLASSDKAAQAGQYIKGLDSIIGGTTSTIGEVGSTIATKGASLSMGVGSGIPSIISGAIELQKSAPKSVSGNSSPSTAIMDALYPYLIIEKPIYKNADNVRGTYNKPDMTVRTIGDLNGYAVFTDIVLKCDAELEERNEIISLLSSGVFV